MNQELNPNNKLSFRLVISHYFLGILGLMLASIFIIFHYHKLSGYPINGPTLAIIHIIIFGWINMILYGAIYHFVPQLMSTKLFNKKLAIASLGFNIAGLALITPAFLQYHFTLSRGFEIGGTLLFIGVVTFIINLLKSILGSKQNNLSKKYFISALFFLILSILMGFFTLVNNAYQITDHSHFDLLKIHALLGLGGWYMNLFIGISILLASGLSKVEKINYQWIKFSFLLFNLSLISIGILIFLYPSFILFQKIIFSILLLSLLPYMNFILKTFIKPGHHKLTGKKMFSIGFFSLGLSLLGFEVMLWLTDETRFSLNQFITFNGMFLLFGFYTSFLLGLTQINLNEIHAQKNANKTIKNKRKKQSPGFLNYIAKIQFYTFIFSLSAFAVGMFFNMDKIILIGAIMLLISGILYTINLLKA